MKPVKCSWKDMQKIRQMLATGERGEQADHFDLCVSFHQRDTLPQASGAYLAFTDFAPLYAGMTLNVRARWKTHTMCRRLRLLEDSYIAFRATEPHRIRQAEIELIEEYRPLWQKND